MYGMNMSAWTTKQSKCVYRIHHTQTHKGTKTQVYSNGLVFLSEHCCLPFTCMWTWLRCSTKTCILIPRRALSRYMFVFVCDVVDVLYGLISLNGPIWYENQIGFSVRANTSISECGSLCIFLYFFSSSGEYYFGRRHHSLVNGN